MLRAACALFVVWTASVAASSSSQLDPAEEARLVEAMTRLFGEAVAPPEARRLALDPPSPMPPAPRGSATMTLRDYHLNRDRLSASTLALFDPILARPNDPDGNDYVKWGEPGTYTASTVSSERFVVHYVSAPVDHASYATAAFAGQTLDALETSVAVQNLELGWPYPPSDDFYTSSRDNGGDGRYDVYLADLGGYTTPYFGYVMPEMYVPGAPGVAVTSYMVLDNDYDPAQFASIPSPLEALRATVAHEYNHACQYALNYDDPERWFYETTATHMEYLVYPGIDDYLRYLPAFFSQPGLSLRFFVYSSPNPNLINHPYGAAVWNHYLTERFGAASIREIWEATATGGTAHPTLLQGMQERLAALGTSLPDEFGRFSAWNFLTGTRADAAYYPEGASWPEVGVPAAQSHGSFPASRTILLDEGPQRMATSYVAFAPNPSEVGRIRFQFQGGEGGEWRLWMVGRADDTTVMEPIALDSAFRGEVDVDNAHRFGWLGFVLANGSALSPNSTRAGFSYHSTFEHTLGAAESWLLVP